MFRILMTSGLAMTLACAHAQTVDTTEALDLAYVAGYKAQFTCSGTFNAGKSKDAIAADELSGIYPDYRDALATLPEAQIELEKGYVGVKWSDTLPDRYAIHLGDGLGCRSLPIGAKLEDFVSLAKPARSSCDPKDVSGLVDPDASSEGVSVPVALGPVIASAFDGKTDAEGNKTSAILIVKDGVILGEKYFENSGACVPQRTWSVGKSISATVIGAAVYQELLDVKAPTGLKAWGTPGDPRQAITLENLLQMASGLDSGEKGSRSDQIYFGGGSVDEYAMNRSLEVAPGTRFKYANDDTLLAMRTLREKFPSVADYNAFPKAAVLDRLGMNSTSMETDWRGNFVSSSQVWTTARDLAKLGQLYLNDGVWAGQRILPEGWAKYVAAPTGPQPEAGNGYGAQFWLPNGKDGLPDDVYMAAGHRGQYVVIVPSENMVIVRRGYDQSGGPGGFEITKFTADVLAAMQAE